MNPSFSPAADRNKEPIARILMTLLPQAARVLEIGSGTGQHAEFLLGLRADLRWTATDRAERLEDLQRRFSATKSPVEIRALDVGKDDWPAQEFDAVFTANTLHIMPWPCSPILFENAAAVLKPGGRLFCYGPFSDRGRHNSDGNWQFDRTLRSQDPDMGLRDLSDLRQLGQDCQIPLIAEFSMPANNRVLVFERS